MNWSYAARFESVKARLESKADDLARLQWTHDETKQALADSNRERDALRQAADSATPPEVQGDPDAIIQDGRMVGTVVEAEVWRHDGIMVAKAIKASGGFNKGAPFKWRGSWLKIEQSGIMADVMQFGKVSSRTIQNVHCRFLD